MDKKTVIMEDLKRKAAFIKKAYLENELIAIFLQGSQNYGLDDEKSDIDAKAFVIPTVRQLIRNEMVNKLLVLDDQSHIEVKDIRLMISLLDKSNPPYLELLYTEYCIIYNESFYDVLSLRDDIAEANKKAFYKAISGMINQKARQAYVKRPGNSKEFDNFGVDVKAISHLYRFIDMAMQLMNGVPFHKALIPADREKIMKIKRGRIIFPKQKIDDDLFIYTQKIEDYIEHMNFERDDDILKKVNDIIENMIIFSIHHNSMNKEETK